MSGCSVHGALLETMLNDVFTGRVAVETDPNCPVHFRVVHCLVVHHDYDLQNQL